MKSRYSSQRIIGNARSYPQRNINSPSVLYAKATFPLILCISLVVNFHVVSKFKEQSLRAAKDQIPSTPKKSVIESSSKALHRDSPTKPKTTQSINPFSIVSETIREVTAYNAGDPSQTDEDPCVSANGENICAALKAGLKRCAANFVSLGTMLQIDKFGVCKVTDRMNKRYKNRVDIAMRKHEKKKALKFGLQKLKVQILKINS